MASTNYEDVSGEGSVAPVYLIPLPADELAALEQAETERLEREQASQASRESAVSKLLALGLTTQEVASLLGN